MIFKIIEAAIEDAAILTDITKTSKAYWGYSQEQLAEWDNVLTVSTSYIQENEVFNIIIDNQIIGYYSYFEEESKTVKLDNIFITPAFIKKGIGTILMKDFIERVFLAKYKSIILDSEPNAKDFYKKFGFEVIEKKPTSIEGRFLPIMKLNLDK